MSLLKMPAVLRKLLENAGLGPHVKRELWPVDLEDFTFPPSCAAEFYPGKDGRKYLIAGYGVIGDQEYTIFVTLTTCLNYRDQGFSLGKIGNFGAYTQYHPDKPPEEVPGYDRSKPLIFYPTGEGPDIPGAGQPIDQRNKYLVDLSQTATAYYRASIIAWSRKQGLDPFGSLSLEQSNNSSSVYSYSTSIRTGPSSSHAGYSWIPQYSEMHLLRPLRIERGVYTQVEVSEGVAVTYVLTGFLSKATADSNVQFLPSGRNKSDLLNPANLPTVTSYRQDLRRVSPFDLETSSTWWASDPASMIINKIYDPYFKQLDYVFPYLIDGIQWEIHCDPYTFLGDDRHLKRQATVLKYKPTEQGPSAYQLEYGEARWHLTHWRQWLNATDNRWWSQLGTYDVPTIRECERDWANNEYHIDNGFLSRIDPDIAAAAIPIPKKTYYYDSEGNRQVSITNDKVWIASLEEIGMTPFNEGEDQCLCHWRYNPGDAVPELKPDWYTVQKLGYDMQEGSTRTWPEENGYLVRSVDDSGLNKFVKVVAEDDKFSKIQVLDFKSDSLGRTTESNDPKYAIICIAAKGIWG